MASYIHFSNDVEGPCEKTGHEGWIELTSWGWGCSREESGGNQPGMVAGIPKFENLTFEAPIGSATANLFQKMVRGEHFDEVIVHATKNVGAEEAEAWLILTLVHVIVTSVNESVAEDEANDTVTLAFTECTLEVADQLKDGSLDTAKQFEYDLRLGK